MKPALLVIDLQKAYYGPSTKQSMDSAVEYINAVIPVFRKQGFPVVWIQHRDEEDGALPGLPGFDFLDSLKPEEGDLRITKEYGNSFNKTGLADRLSAMGADTVVITGYCAEFCVLSTYRGALDLDLAPVILKGGISSGNSARLDMVLDISEVISYGILTRVLANL